MNFEELFEHLSYLETSFTIEEALLRIADIAYLIFDADSVTIIDVSKPPYHFVVLKKVSSIAAKELEKLMEQGLSKENLEIVKKEKLPFVISDTLKSPYWVHVENSPKSWIGIPIVVEGSVNYIVNVDKQIENFFTEESLPLATAFSKFISNAYIKTKKFEEFSETARKDNLTGLMTRQDLYERLLKFEERYRKFGKKFSCLMLDVDKFKQINDTLGHDKGDLALKYFSSILMSNIRDKDLIFRFGGDEFIIILEDADENTARQIAIRLKNEISKVFIENFQLSSSIGVKEYRGEAIEEFLKQLDVALYNAKKSSDGIFVS